MPRAAKKRKVTVPATTTTTPAGAEGDGAAEGGAIAVPVPTTAASVESLFENLSKRAEEAEAAGRIQFPLAKLKRIMKEEEGVKLMSSDCAWTMGKACEMFIMELTVRAWSRVLKDGRKILQARDIINAAFSHNKYDFLVDILPREAATTAKSDIGIRKGIVKSFRNATSSPLQAYFQNIQAPATAAAATADPSSQLRDLHFLKYVLEQTISSQNGEGEDDD